jgi:hypothetical protein
MVFSENRCPPRIKSGAAFFGIMVERDFVELTHNVSVVPGLYAGHAPLTFAQFIKQSGKTRQANSVSSG